MAATKDPLLRILGHVGHQSFEFAGGTDIDQGELGAALGESSIVKGADLIIETSGGNRIGHRRVLGHLPSEGTPLGDPLVASAVHDPHLRVTEETEDPQGVAGPPVGLISVKDAGGLGRDAVP